MNRLKKIKINYLIMLMIILTIYICFFNIVPTLMKYYSKIDVDVTGYGAVNYSITYIDGENQETVFFTSNNMPYTVSNPTKAGYTFLGWYEDSEFSGENILEITENRNYTLYARWIEGVKKAEINNQYFDTLQAAISNVPTDGTETTIRLLANTSEELEVASGKNIVFNFQNYVVSNNGNKNVFKNYGTVKIQNGIIRSSASTNGAFNNETGAILVMTGGRIEMTGGRQCIYNNGGTATISGNSYLISAATERATVHNLVSKETGVPGTLTITGGTIISENLDAVLLAQNTTATIGVKDGSINNDSITMQGYRYGINIGGSMTFNLYDGIVKGKTNAISSAKYISDKEEGSELVTTDTEAINGNVYKLAYILKFFTVTLNPNGGTISKPSLKVGQNRPIGVLPTPTRANYMFQGWYTALSDGEEVNSDMLITGNIEIFAIWVNYSEIETARIGNNTYSTLQGAINDVQADGTPVTIELLRNTAEVLSVEAGKNIIFDLDNYTIRNSGDLPIIENNGTITITNGTIASTASQGAINNEETGVLIITGGTISTTGSKQCIYNVGGTVNISGTASLTSTSDIRATVHNKNNGTMTITGGTIISTAYCAVKNDEGIVSIGSQSATYNDAIPEIRGSRYGVCSNSTTNFYNGVIYGRQGIVASVVDLTVETQVLTNGEFSNLRSGYELAQDEVLINNLTYQKAYLTIIEQSEPESNEPESINLDNNNLGNNNIENSENVSPEEDLESQNQENLNNIETGQ